MKLDSLLPRLGLAAIIAFSAGLALDIAAVALFAFAASVLLIQIGAADYRVRSNYAARTTIALHRRERMPLAA
jgi:ABC-type nickel/cobalt efflux system permease component RcnA